MERQVFHLADLGPDATGRTLGASIRLEIAAGAEEVVFDCEGLESMSPSFADEVFGKLAAEPNRPHVTIINATPEIVSTIRFAVRERTRGQEPTPA